MTNSNNRTLIVYGDGQRAVLRDAQIDTWFERAKRSEEDYPDPLSIAQDILKEDQK